MTGLSKFIEVNGHHLQAILFIILFITLWNLEKLFGFFVNYKKITHGLVNAPFIIANIPGQLFMAWLFLTVTKWTNNHQFGLLQSVDLKNSWLALLLSFLLLDLGEYLWHLLMHKFRQFWCFHSVHHSDAIVDVSTTLREHPGENLIRLSFTLIWVFLSGSSIWMLLVRQIIQVFSTLFAHMNYRIPERLDNVLGWFIITPNLHQVHHHFKQPYTDSNYGDVLSIWHRLFGTLRKLPANQIHFGVDTLPDKKETGRFWGLLKLPFRNRKKSSIMKCQGSLSDFESERTTI